MFTLGTDERLDLTMYICILVVYPQARVMYNFESTDEIDYVQTYKHMCETFVH